MDFSNKNVYMTDNDLTTAAKQDDENRIKMILSQSVYPHKDIPNIIQSDTISNSSKLCIFYEAINNHFFDIIDIFLNLASIASCIHLYKNNSIYLLAKSQLEHPFFKQKYTRIVEKLSLNPGVANEIAKQYITELYERPVRHTLIDCTLLKKILLPVNEIDKSYVLLRAASQNQLEVLHVLLECFHKDITRTDIFLALSNAQNKKHLRCIEYLTNHLKQNVLVLPKKIPLFLSKLKEKEGVLLEHDQLTSASENLFFIKKKHNENFEHSIIQSPNGTLFALYRKGVIGSGAFGKIKLAQNIKNGQICAVKIEKCSPNEAPSSQLLESDILKICELFIDYQENTNFLKKETKKYTFMKYIPGCTLNELTQMLNAFDLKLNWFEQGTLLTSLLCSLQKLKENNISHNDLHSNNVMINPKTMQVTIIDFGKSQIEVDKKIFLELDRLNSALQNLISNPELKKILMPLLHESKNKPVLNVLHNTICAVNEFLQKSLVNTDKTISLLAQLIEKELVVITELEQFDSLKESPQTLLLSKKRKKSHNDGQPIEAFSSDQPTPIKKVCYGQKK